MAANTGWQPEPEPGPEWAPQAPQAAQSIYSSSTGIFGDAFDGEVGTESSVQQVLNEGLSEALLGNKAVQLRSRNGALRWILAAAVALAFFVAVLLWPTRVDSSPRPTPTYVGCYADCGSENNRPRDMKGYVTEGEHDSWGALLVNKFYTVGGRDGGSGNLMKFLILFVAI